MLIPLQDVVKKYNLKIKGVIQVGAHYAEEHEVFVGLGVDRFVYVEPCSDAVNILNDKFGFSKGFFPKNVEIFFCACSDYDGEQKMFVSHQNQGQSNSLLAPKGHLNQHPEIIFDDEENVMVRKLDSLDFDKTKYNLLVMDCQGAEGLVLKGATETLKHIDAVYTEINTDFTYENNILVGEMDELLIEFERVETFMPSPNLTWGDAVYIRKTLLQ